MGRSRRRRLRLTIALGGAVVLATVAFVDSRINATWIPADPTRVGIVRTGYWAPPDSVIDTMVRDAVALAGGLEGIVSPGDDVIVKPNCVETVWAKGGGVVTNCEVTREVVRMCQELGAASVKIAVGTAQYRDGEGSDRFCSRKAFHDAGYDLNWDLVDDATGAGFVDLNDVGQTYPNYPYYQGPYDSNYVTEITLPVYWLHEKYWIANDVADCDVMIDVPVIKNHSTAGVTMALKNYIGIAPNDIYHYPGLNKYKWALVHLQTQGYSEREVNARAIVDLNLCRPADFVVMDALVGITDGPVGGTQANPRVRCIVAGQDPVAVDTVGTLMMGYTPSSIPSITYAAQAGLGTNDLSKITVVGEHVADVRVNFPDGYGGAARCDTTSPTMTGFYPYDSTTVYGTVQVRPEGIWDNIGVVKAELYVDGEPYGGTNAYPFYMDWDTTTADEGAHELTVYIYDNALNEASATHTVTVDNYASSAKALGSGWNLVSVPLAADDPEASAVFDKVMAAGNSLVNNLWAFEQGAGYSGYDSGFTEVELGRGYWLFLSNAATEDCAGWRQTSDVTIPLADGWTLFGNPYPNSQAWSSCTISDGVQTKTIAEAADAGWIQAAIYYYDGGEYRITQPGGGDDQYLRAWRGYWILANQAGLTLTVPMP